MGNCTSVQRREDTGESWDARAFQACAPPRKPAGRPAASGAGSMPCAWAQASGARPDGDTATRPSLASTAAQWTVVNDEHSTPNLDATTHESSTTEKGKTWRMRRKGRTEARPGSEQARGTDFNTDSITAVQRPSFRGRSYDHVGLPGNTKSSCEFGPPSDSCADASASESQRAALHTVYEQPGPAKEATAGDGNRTSSPWDGGAETRMSLARALLCEDHGELLIGDTQHPALVTALLGTVDTNAPLSLFNDADAVACEAIKMRTLADEMHVAEEAVHAPQRSSRPAQASLESILFEAISAPSPPRAFRGASAEWEYPIPELAGPRQPRHGVILDGNPSHEELPCAARGGTRAPGASLLDSA
ncbi:unnamed protein product [Pedinophyceae sp. YPF-701]|nr:unnamed protein product [Pedinophyceae sp. YPF-701]